MKKLLFSVFHEKKGQIPIYTDINDDATIKGCTRVLISIMSNLEQDQSLSGEALVPLLDMNLVLFLRYFHLDLSDAKEQAFCFIAWILEKDNKDVMYYSSHMMLNLFIKFESLIRNSMKSQNGSFDSLFKITEKAINQVKDELGTILDDFFMCSVEDLHKSIPLNSFVSEICLICYKSPTEIKRIMGSGSSTVDVGVLGTKIVTGLLLNKPNLRGEVILPVIETKDCVFCSFYSSGNEIFMVLLFSQTKELIYEWANLISTKTNGFFEIMIKNNLKIKSDAKNYFKNELK